MSTQPKVESGKMNDKLFCSACGNNSRFIEVMEQESNLVNADLIYLGLVTAEVDHYTCVDCGELVAIMGEDYIVRLVEK